MQVLRFYTCVISSCHTGLGGNLRFYRVSFGVGMDSAERSQVVTRKQILQCRIPGPHFKFQEPSQNIKIISGNRNCLLSMQELLIHTYQLGITKDYLIYECFCLPTNLRSTDHKVNFLFNQSKKKMRQKDKQKLDVTKRSMSNIK